MSSIADQVRKVLTSSHRSITSVSEETGVHRVSLHQFIAGRRELPADQLEAIAKVLGYGIELKSRDNQPKKR